MELKKLVLSALLHDIGKFAQRANRPYSKELQTEYLPVFGGKSSHWHALYSDYFIEKDLPLPVEIEEFRSVIARTASIHHRPVDNNLEEMCVSIADRLSSGADRMENIETESKTGFRESRLISVFDEIELINHEFKAQDSYHYKLASLDVNSENIFPAKGGATGPADEYRFLFDHFNNELVELNTGNGFSFYLESLIAILEKYTWAIPSSTYNTLSDVPLFDHCFSTAGIAQALFLYHKETGTIPAWKDEEAKFRLLSGDLSGIQNYIFGISHSSGRGVSKIFRARSFFLQAISQSVIIEIQNRLGLFSVCRLVDSGGKFILILPNTSSITNEMEKIDHEIQTWFRQKFKGLLTFSLSWGVCLAHKDFQVQNFQDKMDESNEALNTSKLQKLHKTFITDGIIVDGDYEEYESSNCSLCGVNASDKKATEIYGKDEGSQLPICKDCCEQITYIGRGLPRANYIVYGRKGRIPLFGNIYLSVCRELEFKPEDCMLVETLKDEIGFTRARIARHLPLLSSEELKDKNFFALFEKEDGFQDMVSRIEESPDTIVPKTFSMIADKSRKTSQTGELVGRPLLGFLKADVDNLGFMFSAGLGEKFSIARLATLSRMVNLFFSDYLVALLKKEFPDIYVVFAGGDDLFLIGPWHQTISFALTMRRKMSEFCAMNPDITLSCGILAAKPRLPMRKALEITENHLEYAKKQKTEDRVKDAVSFLDEVVSWKELEQLIDIGKRLDKAIEEKERTRFSNAFLYRLLNYHRMYRDFLYNGNIKSGRYLSHAHYDIARNIYRANDNGNKEELDLLYNIFSIHKDTRTELDHLNIPLFYAMNLNRNY